MWVTDSTIQHIRGGVGTSVGLTFFKTAGGPLGAVPGGFDCHLEGAPLEMESSLSCSVKLRNVLKLATFACKVMGQFVFKGLYKLFDELVIVLRN